MKTVVITFSLAVGWLIANAALAGEACNAPAACTEVQTCGGPNCCAHCGCQCCCTKYCKLVCETKEIKKHVWVVKCSDFCTAMPGCGCHCCSGCGSCLDESGCCGHCGSKCDPCAVENSKCIVPPNCGRVHNKKTLVKKEVTCKVPSYKCVVVYCCPHCGCDPQQGAAPGKPTEAPLPPASRPASLK